MNRDTGFAEGGCIFLYIHSVAGEALIPKLQECEARHAQIRRKVFPGTLMIFSGVPCSFRLFYTLEKMLHFHFMMLLFEYIVQIPSLNTVLFMKKYTLIFTAL